MEIKNKLQRENGDEKLIIYGRNVIKRAITNKNDIERVYIQEGIKSGSMGEIITQCKKNAIVIQEVPKQKLENIVNSADPEANRSHQGIAALLSAVKYVEVDEIIAYAKTRGEQPFLVILNEILDPHNYGAIVRSAEAFGAHGVIISKHKSAPSSAAAVKSSAGALLNMKIAKVTNINNCIDKLKEENIWVYGAEMDGQSIYSTDLKGALAIVIGSEGKGLSTLTKKKCDIIVSIPMRNNVDSLNASNAAAVIMSEKNRQDLNVKL